MIASGVDWTLPRHNLYAETILMGASAVVASGQLFSATSGLGRSYVAREDCARVDAGVLLSATGRQILDVSGSTVVTPDEVAALLAQISSRPVISIGVSSDQLRAGLARLPRHGCTDREGGDRPRADLGAGRHLRQQGGAGLRRRELGRFPPFILGENGGRRPRRAHAPGGADVGGLQANRLVLDAIVPVAVVDVAAAELIGPVSSARPQEGRRWRGCSAPRRRPRSS